MHLSAPPTAGKVDANRYFRPEPTITFDDLRLQVCREMCNT